MGVTGALLPFIPPSPPPFLAFSFLYASDTDLIILFSLSSSLFLNFSVIGFFM